MKEEWKSISKLRKVDMNYSGMPYSYEYAKETGLLQSFYSEQLGDIHTVGIHEGIEICWDAGLGVLYRELENGRRKCNDKEVFVTQFGKFQNYDRGEFGGEMITPAGIRVNGNFKTVVDHKKKVFAVDSMHHFGAGHFRLLEFTGAKRYRELYATTDAWADEEQERLEYGALFAAGNALYFILSGYVWREQRVYGLHKTFKGYRF